MRFLFQLSNTSSALDACLPVMRELRQRDVQTQCEALVLSEYYRMSVDQEALQEHFDAVHVFSPKSQGARLHQRLMEVFRFRREVGECLKGNEIDVLIAQNDRQFPEYDCVKTANSLGIPTFLFQESIRKDCSFAQTTQRLSKRFISRMADFQTGNLLHGQGGCKKILAWGEEGKAYFTRAGVSPERIVLTGSPRLDIYLERARKIDVEAIRARLGIEPGTRAILFATNPLYSMRMAPLKEYLEAVRLAIRVAGRLDAQADGPPCRLLVKPHRFEIEEHKLYGIHEQCAAVPYADFLPDLSIEESIAISDSVMIFNSTVALEAGLFGKPVGIWNPLGWQMGTDFVERGLASLIENEEQLALFMQRDTMTNSEGPSQVAYYLDHIGESASQIADLLLASRRV